MRNHVHYYAEPEWREVQAGVFFSFFEEQQPSFVDALVLCYSFTIIV